MNLALVTHNVIVGDGQGRVNYELTRYLLARGHQVTLVADTVDPALEAAGARWIRLRAGRLADRVDLVKVWRFKRMADRLLARITSQFDAVLACGVVLNRPHTLNAVHFAHGPWLHSPYHNARVQRGPNAWYQWLFTALNARWERQTLAKARRVVAVSAMVHDELVAAGVDGDKVEVVVNGVDLDEFAPGPADRAMLGLPTDVPLGLFVGDVRSSIKNLDAVLEGLAHVPDAHLAVAGCLADSPYPALADRLGVAGRVHFLDFRRDVADLMRAADFFALPSRRDSCPLVLLEAMASGLPVITSRNVGTANLVTADAGFVLDDPDDQATMQHALHTFATNPVRRTGMGQGARRIAEEHSWARMAARYVDLLEALVSSAPHARIHA